MEKSRTAAVQLLGSAKAHLAERQVAFVPDKRYQLLAYLAYQGNWVNRERLAFLFWPDSDSTHAKQNLRGLLKRVHGLEWLSGLEADNYQLRWQVETDVAAFRQALEDTRLEEALTLYTGPLLNGMGSDEAPEFSDWLELERGRFYSSWREAVLERVRELEDAGQHKDAAMLLKHLVEEDELDEEALQRYMHAAAQAGQVQVALRSYKSFARRLEEELGMEPTSITQQLEAAIKEMGMAKVDIVFTSSPAEPASLDANVDVSTPRSSLPFSSTSFVGRDVELAEVSYLLAQPDCRLLTLTGPGGIGKTRVALQIARDLEESFRGGAYFIPLESLTSPASIIPSITTMLGLEPGKEEPFNQLLHHLHNKQLLLVLDNYEHLLDGAMLVSNILSACPGVKVFATSRERLNLEEERLLPLEGLGFPETNTNLEDALAHDAVQLFCQRAKRVLPHFEVGENLPYILEICRLVQGHPLGLELAAVWVRALPVADIAREVRTNLDLLSSNSRNANDRHKSIRAAFDYSWRLLSLKEQDTLAKLAVFRGGFTREAAVYVADASVAVLAALVDKSLLQLSPSGRYERHPLLYQYSQEKLAGHFEAPEVRERHRNFYFQLLQQQEGELLGTKVKQALSAIEEELENIRLAWSWAVSKAKYDELKNAALPIRMFFTVRSRFQEGIGLFNQAQAALHEANPAPYSALGYVMVAQGWLLFSLTHYEQANYLAERSLELLRPLGEIEGILSSLHLLSSLAWRISNYPLAKDYLKEGIALCRTQKDLLRTADFLNQMGFVETLQGNSHKADQYLLEALDIYRQAGRLEPMVENLHNIGFSLIDTGDLQEAERVLRQALDLAKRITDQEMIPHILNQLGLVAFEFGDYARAEALCQEALQIAKEDVHIHVRGWTLVILGKTAMALADYTSALAHLTQALKTEWSLRHLATAISAVVAIAELRIRQGKAEEAVGLLITALHHPATGKYSKTLAQRLLNELQSQLPLEVMARAMERGKTASLKGVVEEILEQSSLQL